MIFYLSLILFYLECRDTFDRDANILCHKMLMSSLILIFVFFLADLKELSHGPLFV